jgi:preprotein translocase subunit SecD
MATLKRVIFNWRVLLALFFIAAMLAALRPSPFNEGVVIKAVLRNSSADEAGVPLPKQGAPPLSRDKLVSINNIPIRTLQDYFDFTRTLQPNRTVQVRTSGGVYRLTTRPILKVTELNESEEVTVEELREVNETVNGTVTTRLEPVNATRVQPKRLVEVIGTEDLGLRLDEAPNSNLRLGLDLQGGTRVLLRPAENVTDDVLSAMVDSLKERLNVYGLSDIIVTEVRNPLGGVESAFILVEVAGATEDEVRELIGRQGKFEARIGNQTVFLGGANDITYVCRTATCSGIDPNRACGPSQGGWACGFLFSITLSPAAAQRQADLTRDLAELSGQGGRYLSEPLRLYLDDQLVDELQIAADLKGRPVTDIAITGGGAGPTEVDAVNDALLGMRRLQTVLITGSLPAKLEVFRADTISPSLGEEFSRNALLMAGITFAAVFIVLFLVYRRLKIGIAIILTAIAEVLSTLGMYAIFGWSLDLASIAGIIVAVGTGVNDQVIITDEALRRRAFEAAVSLKERLKRAFGVIFSAYLTIGVAMVPLLFAGAGLLRGFAITTLIGVTAGILITRPAFAAVVQRLVEE